VVSITQGGVVDAGISQMSYLYQSILCSSIGIQLAFRNWTSMWQACTMQKKLTIQTYRLLEKCSGSCYVFFNYLFIYLFIVLSCSSN